MSLPNFLILGAARSGTTTLHEVLGRHPEVFVSAVKEPSYFALAGAPLPEGPGNAWLRSTAVTTREGYEALFTAAGDAKAIGEASPRYLFGEDVATRIHATLPGARLIAILRDPVERAFANYLAFRRDGYDPAPTFEASLDDQERRQRAGWALGAYVRYGFTARPIAAYRRLFPAEQMRIYFYEDLVRDPQALLRDLLGFLGVDATVVPAVGRHGRTGIVRDPVLRWLWSRSARPRLALGALFPRPWRDAVHRRVMRDLDRPRMAPATRARLVQLYRDDTLELQGLVGRDLSSWLRAEEADL